ncbi:p-hydroxybenzoic acid efflux pump subunit AaeA [BD1-7 clade bacterium]|uniref:p-hydroxybenzoic acid efflux pump subunit AaeA n=1 Tax=BD1-7 clade bacterium TaxID=2029982 RepID=A0A5S9QDY9_9GAMM|nr:p-hydroxybenzoic acid efflux pump subunit AaeA [BD1-7 clade bacterium]CAA0116549.1 p-hydroxybenzoic acid efflux pump subunit AaeA [BD1-7 clade bacterium]CAA0120178.1 p-hydroxybenzoic acid efflux pump subunit AaeA [BD1-7 clade bacterium]
MLEAAKKQLTRVLKPGRAKTGVLISAGLTALLGAHLVTSDVVVAGKGADSDHSHSTLLSQSVGEKPRLDVEVLRSPSETIYKELVVYGRTEPERTVELRSEISAPVLDVATDKGVKAQAGDVIITLDAQTLNERLAHATMLVKQRKLEFDSARTLQKEGFQARLFVAETETNLAQARADLAMLEKERNDTHIRAPFAGVINKRMVEVGDFVQTGSTVVELVDLDPLLVRVHIPETRISEVHRGQTARVKMLDGSEIQGEVRFVSQNSVQGTNTFDVELAIANADFLLSAGVSAEVTLFTDPVVASQISPSYLSLDDKGRSGLYVVEDGVARFKPARIVRSDARNLWVEGLGLNPVIIISGHHHVRDGDAVVYNPENQTAGNTLPDQAANKASL